MKNFSIFVLLLITMPAVGNEAHYDSSSGILFIPSAVVDGETHYKNVSILLDKDSSNYSILNGEQIPMPDGPFKINLKFDTFAQLINRTEIRFVNVVSDSRCPSDVQCIIAGEAVVLISIRTYNSQTSQTLSLNLSGDGALDPKGVLMDGYYFRLLELNPYPRSVQPETDLAEMDVVVEYAVTPFED